MRTLPVAISFVVTFQSSNLFLGFPAEAYAYGMQYCLQCIGVLIAYSVASVIVVPIFHPLRLTSMYEYYYLRYETNAVRFLGASTGTVYYVFYMGVVMFGTSLAIESVTGVDRKVALVFLANIATLYTTIGGIKGVIWADVFQFVVMVAGILAVLLKTTQFTGGIKEVLKTSQSRLNFITDPDPTIRHSVWNLVLGSIPNFFYLTIIQAGIQRVNAVSSANMAKLLYLISGPIYSLVWITVMFQGMTMFAYFTNKSCDPLAAGILDNLNKIFPHTVMELFHSTPGLPGLFISALCSASLSTISSGLNSLSAIFYANFISVFLKSRSHFVQFHLPKVIVVIFGIISFVCAFVLSNMKGPLAQILDSFMGALVGVEIGVYLTSIFFRMTTVKGIFVGATTGFALILWINIGQTFVAKPSAPFLQLGPTDGCAGNTTVDFKYAGYLAPVMPSNVTSENTSSIPGIDTPSYSPLTKLYSLSYMYFGLLGTLIVITVTITTSLLTQPKTQTQVPDNLVLSLRQCLPFCFRECSCNKKKPSKEVERDRCEMEKMVVPS